MPERPDRPDRSDRPDLRIVASHDDTSLAAATFIADHLAAAIAARGVAHWSTTGGSACPGIYRALRSPALRDTVDWARVQVWWGDDRFVPAGDPLCNVTPFDELFRAPGSGIDIPDANVHAFPCAEAIGRGAGPAEVAAAYEAELRSAGPPAGANGVPVFDVIVLGVGPDGHVLSVFPGSAVWDERTLVAPVPAPTHVEPHLPRVTMHPRMLAAARSVVVVASGASKARVLARAWSGSDVRELPVRVTMASNATWILDEAAAAELPRGDRPRATIAP
jgi:6-phosphogluconolactonase